MNLSVGIVGLPNVGKSTLFNALLKKQQALAANYPFATIEPNVGVVPVPDVRLQKLADITAEEIAGHKELNPATGSGSNGLPPIRPATVEFVDIAGLVKGASEGEGLGNKFLSHIREVRVICHVVRAFEDADIIREGSIDPKSDYETIETELALADLQTISKIKDQKSKIQVKGQKEAVSKLFDCLDQGKPARFTNLTEEENEAVKDFHLLTAKPEIIVLNVSEEQYTPEGIKKVIEKYSEMLKDNSVIPAEAGIQSKSVNGSPIMSGMTNIQDEFVVICAKIEAELAALSEEEQKEYLSGLGLRASGLERLIQTAYSTLDLISFLTAGEKEVRSWTIKKGTNAQNAAGEIHTDFIKKFIKAEIVGYEDFVANHGWKASREVGKARLEGKDYIVKDGDVVEFKIGN